MGINPFWQEDVFLTLQAICHKVDVVDADKFSVIETENLALNLISLNQNHTPKDYIALQERYQQSNKQLVHLWEDIWHNRRNQVLSRFRSFSELNDRFHGRKAKVREVSISEAKDFLGENHLQGYINAKIHYGLFNGNDIIAVASFSMARPMKSKGEDYKSAELVRFATKAGVTVVGGLSKLIKHYLKLNPVNDLMTYADRDWSLGKGYDKMGFKLTETVKPMFFYSNMQTGIRYLVNKIPQETLCEFEQQKTLTLHEFLIENGYQEVFNTGNLKYLYYT
ncbi:MAG: hypothetical protein EOO87_06150 [Pedobacter sp.]|nr:MAG: hypothetical protein EOO87_06150 [Pedobacter sp.]